MEYFDFQSNEKEINKQLILKSSIKMVSILRKDGLLKKSRLKFLQLPDQDKEKILKRELFHKTQQPVFHLLRNFLFGKSGRTANPVAFRPVSHSFYGNNVRQN